MAKYLLIVESPNKCSTIKKYLGKDYSVIASYGHFRDLPPKKMGINIKKDFEPTYEIIEGKEQVVKNILAQSKKVDLVYLATDLDREGEAISFHISQILPKGTKTKRIVYNAITKKAIQKAIDEAGEIDANMVAAYETRRILDRIVGFKCSFPVSQATGGRSAGRVQSSTLRFLADKEKLIQNFIPIKFWDITAELITNNYEKIIVKLIKPDKLKVNSKEQATKICDTLKKGPINVSFYEKKETLTKPYAPFVTNTLQQSASTFLGWAPKKTMKVAQDLFSAGIITYHRTDSRYITSDAVNAIRTVVSNDYGASYLPSKQWFYSKSKNAQEAHEAIRPTDVNVKQISSADGGKLYKMIWKRAVASQMGQAKFLKSKAEFACKKYILGVTGSKCTFDGWRKCWDYGSLEDFTVPELKEGESVKLIDVSMKEDETKPPPRYTEASTIKQMEKLGIGRPSTYAATLETLKNRDYIEVKKKSISVTDLGIRVVDFLVEADFCFVNLQFTSDLESKLDDIANKKADKVSVLNNFWDTLKLNIKNAKAVKDELSKTDYDCPLCKKNSKLVLKHSKYGPFYACENRKLYNCDYTANVNKETGEPQEKIKKKLEESDIVCLNCGEKLIIRTSKKNTKYLGCRNWNKDKSCLGFYDLEGNKIKFKKKKYHKKK